LGFKTWKREKASSQSIVGIAMAKTTNKPVEPANKQDRDEYMVTDRIMEKKTVQLRQAAPMSVFSIIGFFTIRVQNIPEVRSEPFFSIILGGDHYFHN
jgi:hypothetical protein